MRIPKLTLLVVIAGVAGGAGCSKVLGIDDLTLVDAGNAGDDAGPDASDLTIRGRSFVAYTHGAQTTEVGADLSALVVQALLAEGTGYRAIDAVVGTDGQFTIDGVPPGAMYLLKIGRAYYATDARNPTLVSRYAARVIPLATQATSVQLNLSGFRPFQFGSYVYDNVRISSALAGYDYYASPAAGGDTAITGSFDWRDGFGSYNGGAPLVDSAAGDDLTVVQERTQRIPNAFNRNWVATTITAALPVTPFTITDGGPASITGTLTEVPATRSFPVTMTRGAFDSIFHAGSRVAGLNASLSASPGLSDYAIAPVVSVNFYDWGRGTSMTGTAAPAYGDPYPASWTRYVTQTYTRSRRLLVPGSSVPGTASAGYYREALAGPPLPFTPSIQPPPNVRFAGQDAFGGGRVSFDGTSAVSLSWGAVPSARMYRVLIRRAYVDGIRTRTTFAGALSTRATSIDIPAEVFAGGEYFTFTVAAISAANNYGAGELQSGGHPYLSATHLAGLFRLSATCGNAATEAGEDCDTGTATAACDVDCTTPMCGDGVHNAAAGEACDDADDTLRCDADCTPAACGDGHVNSNTEDCDDGNATDEGNGCSTGCRYNNLCGDAVVALHGEECDTGGDSATCDADCTYVQCGDTHANTAAGETCDDGSTDPNDGCDISCHLE